MYILACMVVWWWQDDIAGGITRMGGGVELFTIIILSSYLHNFLLDFFTIFLKQKLYIIIIIYNLC